MFNNTSKILDNAMNSALCSDLLGVMLSRRQGTPISMHLSLRSEMSAQHWRLESHKETRKAQFGESRPRNLMHIFQLFNIQAQQLCPSTLCARDSEAEFGNL